jgi:RNA polymerase sigma-70 factor (ECF subfamily)
MSAITASWRRTTNLTDPSRPTHSTHPLERGYGFDHPPARSSRQGGDPGTSWIDPTSILTDFLHRSLRRVEFDRVVGPRVGRLQRLAQKILRSEELADDAVQEALLSLWREERPPQNLDGWLVRAVVNRCLHLNRSRHRRRKHEERASIGRSECDPGGDASRPLEVAEVMKAVATALEGLPDHLRSVFVLREAEQMGYESIAEALGVPVGTVRSRLHRAREALRGALLGSSAVG